jgi:hypothetical protein
MNSDNPVEEQIQDAIASGELTPTRGVGEPFEKFDNDPAWWAKALLGREQAADRYGDVSADRDRRIAQAVNADNLSDARAVLSSLNTDLASWNSRVEEEHRLDLLTEVWLLTERANARR